MLRMISHGDRDISKGGAQILCIPALGKPFESYTADHWRLSYRDSLYWTLDLQTNKVCFLSLELISS